jgi:hypothetical protein
MVAAMTTWASVITATTVAATVIGAAVTMSGQGASMGMALAAGRGALAAVVTCRRCREAVAAAISAAMLAAVVVAVIPVVVVVVIVESKFERRCAAIV